MEVCVHFVIWPYFLTCILNKRHVRNFEEFKVEQGKKSDTEKLNGGNKSEIVLMQES